MYKGYYGLGEFAKNQDKNDPSIEAKIDEYINMCDNLLYTDYFEKGGERKSSAEIKQHIKDEIFHSLVDFFGEEYFDRIFEKMHETTLQFNYSLGGNVSSIENFIIEKQKNHFLEKYGVSSSAITILETELEHVYNFDAQEIIKDKENLLKKVSFIKCLKAAGFSDDILIHDKVDEIEKFIKKIQSMAFERKWSDIPEVEQDLQKLENLLLEAELESHYLASVSQRGRSTEKKEDLESVLRADVLASRTCGKRNDELSKIHNQDIYFYNFTIFRQYGVAGVYSGDDKKVRLSAKSSDWVTMHEFLHAVTESGFKRNNKQKPSSEQVLYSNQYSQNQMLDEVIIDYLVSLIMEQRKKKGLKSFIGKEKEGVSSYSLLFPLIGNFIDDFLPEIKKALMSSDEPPSVVLSRVIGKENFDKLSLGCNEFIGFMQSDLSKMTKGMTFDEIKEFIAEEFERIKGGIDEAELVSYEKDLINYIKSFLREEGVEQSNHGIPQVMLAKFRSEIEKLSKKVIELKLNLKLDPKRYIKSELERIKDEMKRECERARLKVQREKRKTEEQKEVIESGVSLSEQ